MSDFDACIEQLLCNEGAGLVAEDYGRGPSRYGITLKTLQESQPDATADGIVNMTAEAAAEFYRAQFWDRYRIGLIQEQALAFKVLDVGVNIGGGTAIKLLQRAVGATADGIMGSLTAAVVNATDPAEALGSFRIEVEKYYRAVVEAHPERAGELPGWLHRLSL